jgi:hypothetical protein
MFFVGFVAGSLLVGSFGFWLGVRFGVLIVAEQYKREIQSIVPDIGLGEQISVNALSYLRGLARDRWAAWTGRSPRGVVGRSGAEGAAREAARHAIRELARSSSGASERDIIPITDFQSELDFIPLDARSAGASVQRRARAAEPLGAWLGCGRTFGPDNQRKQTR